MEQCSLPQVNPDGLATDGHGWIQTRGAEKVTDGQRGTGGPFGFVLAEAEKNGLGAMKNAVGGFVRIRIFQQSAISTQSNV